MVKPALTKPTSNTVCAVVATRNSAEQLRNCLTALLAQTRLPDCILVVDNASTDDTARMLASDFPQCERMSLGLNSGQTGAFRAGMQWMHCRHDFGWVWTMTDRLEPLPDCLQTMLSWQHAGDLIQLRKQTPSGLSVDEAFWDVESASLVQTPRELGFANGRKWVPAQHCDLDGALTRRLVIERAGLPDPQFFHGGGEAYGFVAALHSSVIRVDHLGAKSTGAPVASPSAALYLSIRNRFLTWEHLVKAGLPLDRSILVRRGLADGFAGIVRAARSGSNIHAALQGLRDGLYSRFDPPVWLIQDEPD